MLFIYAAVIYLILQLKFTLSSSVGILKTCCILLIDLRIVPDYCSKKILVVSLVFL